MGTLASELGGHAERVSGQPRVYVDANVPAGLVSFMRQSLQWDVLFVLEHEELRRARDDEHYRLARQLRRTLITQDRDYLDDRKFPPQLSGGVLVLWAPVEKGLMALLKRVDREVLRRPPLPEASPVDENVESPLPLEGRKLHVHIDWDGENRTVIVVRGGDLILPGRVISEGSLVIDAGRIVAIESGPADPAGATVIDASDCYVAPGFIDVHVHGLHGHDTLDGEGAIARIAAVLPRYGVTAFCPTTVACTPEDLRGVLQQVRQARVSPVAGCARVLPAHLESNFINPDYKGAQPADCLRQASEERRDGAYSGRDVLDVIAACRPDVGIVTLAPELPGGIDLVRSLAHAGHRVSLGHSGSDYDTAIAAIEAGARHATHLFNRMTPMTHRAPGLPGAVLAREEVTVELICDGHHVHPSMCRVAVAAKGPEGVLAITDATSGAGLKPGSTARLGGRSIQVGEQAAFLEDGTLAGSTLTMDRAFRNIVTRFGGSLVDAAVLCATSPARALGLTGFGVLADGAVADLVVLDRAFRVVRTFIGGQDAAVS